MDQTSEKGVDAQLMYPLAYQSNDDVEANSSSNSRLRAAHYISQPTPFDPQDDDDDDKIICRVVLYGLFLLIISTCSTTASFLALHPKLPDFHIDSLVVSHFNISSFGLMGNWDMDIRLKNQDSRMQVIFDHFGIDLIYEDEQTLSSTNLTTFVLRKSEETVLFAHLERKAMEEEKYLVGNRVLKEMSMDRKRGEMNFNMKMRGHISFRIADKEIGEMVVDVFCYSLKVQFEDDNGDAKLTSAGGVVCLYG